jgi:hypothetical protein
MAEYDAFGRKKGEDPLHQPSSTPVPLEPATPSSPSAKGLSIALAAAVVVVLAAAGIALALLSGGTTEGGLIEPVAVEDAPPAPPAEAPETAPAEEGSLLTPELLARAVKAMQVAELGRPVSFRLAADRINAQLVTASGRLRNVQVGPAGVPKELSASEGGNVPSMPWSAVDPAAPQRIGRAAAEREKRSAGDVDYLVLLDLGEPTWGLFFKGGTHYQADATGKKLRRVSE